MRQGTVLCGSFLNEPHRTVPCLKKDVGDKMNSLVYANEKGELFDYAPLYGTGRLGANWVEPMEEELLPLPQGATLTMIPDRYPIGIHPKTGEFNILKEDPYHKGKKAFAVGALLPQGYTRTLLPGCVVGNKPRALPLLGYTAVVFKKGRFFVAALPTDEDVKWNPKYYNTEDLGFRVTKLLKKYPNNRILAQLGKCALEYGCFTAQNIFYERWEGGVPVSPVCNAACLGCISLQPSECCPSPQQRINFVPSLEEVVDLGLHHLKNEESIISFGQGCEGEPSLQAELIAETIKVIRSKTEAGTININTNAGYTVGIKEIVDAGLDTMRVSLVSANPDLYDAYYQPRNYSLQKVGESLTYASKKGVYTSLNLLTFPGVNDREEELESLIEFVQKTGVRLIQIRNLNIDPDIYLSSIPKAQGEVYGTLDFLGILKSQLPDVEIGNYTRPMKRGEN
jgi:pyruvate-formate lyase-activating enzyme